MAKSILGVIVALFLSIFANAPTFANDRLPLSQVGQISTPAVLADRIDESLKKDSSGSSIVRGANATPSQFLMAMGSIDTDVDTYPEMGVYLRSLKTGPMPTGKLHLSEVDRVDGKPVLDLKVGTHRYARDGEKGWYDGYGKFVIAGECMNTAIPLSITIAKPTLVPATIADPYAGKREVRTTSCPLGERGRYVAVHMFEPKAAEVACSKEHMLPQDGNLGAVVGQQKVSSNWSDPDAFSRFCGQQLHEAKYQFGTTQHEVKLAVVVGDKRYDFFSGTLKGKTFTADGESEKLISKDGEAVFVPIDFRSGTVVAFFADQAKVRTPTPSGVGEDLRTFKDGCAVKILTGIDMP